jgi:hypothetical protein
MQVCQALSSSLMGSDVKKLGKHYFSLYKQAKECYCHILIINLKSNLSEVVFSCSEIALNFVFCHITADELQTKVKPHYS